MGETPITSINKENTFAVSEAGKKSRTMARAATIPPQLPNACKNLSAIKESADSVKAQAKEEAK